MTAPDQPTEAPSADRRNEIRALMQEWSSARFTRKGHTPAARSLVADAGLELLAEIDRLRVTHAEFARFVQEAREQRDRADLMAGERDAVYGLVTELTAERDDTRAALAASQAREAPLEDRDGVIMPPEVAAKLPRAAPDRSDLEAQG